MPVQLGLSVSVAATNDAAPIGEARLAEAVGFDFVSASDHLNGEILTFEPWTLLTAIAASTAHIKVATRVLAVPYRHPAVVAKMAETLDRLTDGRLILGLGGGFFDDEFDAFGLDVPSPGDKIDSLEEAVRIARGLWSQSAFTYQGRLFRVHAATLEPKPRHLIPIWLGTSRPRGLALTGRLADGWIPSYGISRPGEVPALREQVDAAARNAGRDPAAITAVYNIEVHVRDRGKMLSGGISGQPAELLQQLIDLRPLGFSGFNFAVIGPERQRQIEQLGREVLPAIREAWNEHEPAHG